MGLCTYYDGWGAPAPVSAGSKACHTRVGVLGLGCLLR
jgi:hypothetical protein